MNEVKRASLLARGEQTLKMLEKTFDKFLREGELDLAWDAKNEYDGAALMLAWLNLITSEDCTDRSVALLNRYIAAHSKEAE